jgi:hypothetical protein
MAPRKKNGERMSSPAHSLAVRCRSICVVLAVLAWPTSARAETYRWEASASAAYLQTSASSSDPYFVGVARAAFRPIPILALGVDLGLGSGVGTGPSGCGAHSPPDRSFSRVAVGARLVPFRFGFVEPWLGVGAGVLAIHTLVCGSDTVGQSPGDFPFVDASAGASFYVSDTISIDAQGRAFLIPFGSATGGDPGYPAYPYGTSPWIEGALGVGVHF